MSTYIIPIQTAFLIFLLLSIFLTIPWLIYVYRKFGYLSIWASIVAFSFVFYMLSALFLVLLPLPDTRDTCAMQTTDTVHYSLIPFYFIADIIMSSEIVWTQPSTYAHVLKQSAFLQAAFNVLLLLPFGVYLRYFLQKKQYWKRALGLGFILSLFYEITQVTGIYGIYNCSYRIFDVDDLILNSTGALLGFLIAPVILALFPSRMSLLVKADQKLNSQVVPPLSQLLAVFIDYLLILLSWNLTIGLFTSNELIELIYKTAGFIIFYFGLPLLWGGKTVGTNIMRFKLTDLDGNVPKWQLMFNRLFSLYLPWVTSAFINVLDGMEIDMDSHLYAYHILITVAVFVFFSILWGVLFIHAIFVIFKKGKRTFYFDHASNIIPRKK
ncbi:VanZ family protein [Gracilibacillus dipsosauri]|uniref:VanZ family protein n=1 Tax=Gracilibacillus dipsosauri TaxID=178340 RepID=A0A317KYU2_9BACI|nr:VanZ family protein [Gracilibacillus dipsosauri]PWU68396.1 VanZ family protein [Gracilibacillus dipsosauri]